MKQVLDTINNSQHSITRFVQQKLSTLNAQLSSISEAIPRLFSIVKTRHEARLDAFQNSITHQAQLKLSTVNSQLSTLQQRLPILLDRRLMKEKHQLQLIEEKAKSLDPTLLLKRGYSMTMKDGKIIRDAASLHPGDEIETRLANGTVRSAVLPSSPLNK